MGIVVRMKSTRCSYGADALKNAIQRVRLGKISKKKAEQVYGVPRRTLTRHLNGNVRSPGCIALGRYRPTLNRDYENAIEQHAVALQQRLFGISTKELPKFSFEIAKKLGVYAHRFKKGIAGKGWMRSFLPRHPGLAIRSPEATSLARAVGFNKPSVDKFYNLYKDELTKSQYGPHRIYNMDESGLTVVHRPGKVVAKRGQKQVGPITSGEKG